MDHLDVLTVRVYYHHGDALLSHLFNYDTGGIGFPRACLRYNRDVALYHVVYVQYHIYLRSLKSSYEGPLLSGALHVEYPLDHFRRCSVELRPWGNGKRWQEKVSPGALIPQDPEPPTPPPPEGHLLPLQGLPCPLKAEVGFDLYLLKLCKDLAHGRVLDVDILPLLQLLIAYGSVQLAHRGIPVHHRHGMLSVFFLCHSWRIGYSYQKLFSGVVRKLWTSRPSALLMGP